MILEQKEIPIESFRRMNISKVEFLTESVMV